MEKSISAGVRPWPRRHWRASLAVTAAAKLFFRTAGFLLAMAVAAANAATCEAPPTLFNPIVYQDNRCPGDTGFPSTVNAGGRDVYVRLPSNRQCTKRLLIQYAGNVRITGGDFSYNDTAAYVIAVRHSSGTTMIDGVSINANGRDADAISTYAHTGRMIIQNTFVRGVKGTPGGTVRDVMEASTAGPLTELVLQNVTALTGGRGLVSFYNSGSGRGTSKLVLDHVNARHDTSLPKWPAGTAAPRLLLMGSPSSTTQQPPPNGTTLSNVYVDGTYWGLPYQKTVYLEPKPQPDGCATFNSTKFAGEVCMASPPGGADYAPAENVGLNYDRTRFCGQEAVNQCDVSQVPPQAAAAGLTRLAFCDDFSDLSKSFDLSTAGWNPSVKWSRRIPWMENKWAAPSSFTSPSPGILRLAPNVDKYQWTMMSADKDSSGSVRGFFLNQVREWYAEIRWRTQNTSTPDSGFPAFWSMDLCHVLEAFPCSPDPDRFVEPDFIELINGSEVNAQHYWNHSMTHFGFCFKYQPPAGGAKITDWHTYAIHVNANQSDGYVDYIRDNTVSLFSIRPGQGCYIGNSEFLKQLDRGRYAINLGTGPTSPIYIDWVRVWTKPS